MTSSEFHTLQQTAKQFPYHSFSYVTWDMVKDAVCIKKSDDHQLWMVSKGNEHKLYWMCTDKDVLFKAVSILRKHVLIAFLPLSWKAYFMSRGFTEYSEFHDFRKAACDRR